MTDPAPETRTAVVEREFAHPPSRVWRAITEPHLLAEWLMQTDFAPEIGHRFTFRANWGEVRSEVLEIEPETRLVYSWDAFDLKSVVTLTLTPTPKGTHLRMEQTGFLAGQGRERGGAVHGWTGFFDRLGTLLDTAL